MRFVRRAHRPAGKGKCPAASAAAIACALGRAGHAHCARSSRVWCATTALMAPLVHPLLRTPRPRERLKRLVIEEAALAQLAILTAAARERLAGTHEDQGVVGAKRGLEHRSRHHGALERARRRPATNRELAVLVESACVQRL
eukprot:5670718-Prymnesium_polylepis.1